MAIYGDDTHLFTLKMNLGYNFNYIDEIINDITNIRNKINDTTINRQEINNDIQRLYKKELSLKTELKGILLELSRIICIGIQEKETCSTALEKMGLYSSIIVRRKPDDEI